MVVASEGYPTAPRTGDPITGLDAVAEVPGVVVLHAGTMLDDAGTLVSAGGRVLDVVAVAPSLAKARQAAYDAVDVIEPRGLTPPHRHRPARRTRRDHDRRCAVSALDLPGYTHVYSGKVRDLYAPTGPDGEVVADQLLLSSRPTGCRRTTG